MASVLSVKEMEDPLRLKEFLAKDQSLYKGLSKIIFDSTKLNPIT